MKETIYIGYDEFLKFIQIGIPIISERKEMYIYYLRKDDHFWFIENELHPVFNKKTLIL